MTRLNETAKFALIGAAGGAVAGLVVVSLVWLFLPRNPWAAPPTPSVETAASTDSRPSGAVSGSAKTGSGVPQPPPPAQPGQTPGSGQPAAGATTELPPRNDLQKAKTQFTKMGQIAQALDGYHGAFRCYPLAKGESWFDEQGRPYLSWRVHLLPFLDQQSLWSQFKANEPWDSPNNAALLDKVPDVFRDEDAAPAGVTTRFMRLTGSGTAFSAPFGPSRESIKNRPATILLIRVGKDRAVPWTKPDDAVFNPDAPLEVLGAAGSEPCLISTAITRVLWLRMPISADSFKSLVTRDRGGPSVLIEYGSRSFEVTPSQQILNRANAAGSRGDWQLAASEFANYFASHPVSRMGETEYEHAFNYGAVLACIGDVQRYEQHCRQVLERIPVGKSPLDDVLTAKMCLLSPTPADILTPAAERTKHSSQLAGSHGSFFIFVGAMAQYRKGDFQKTIDWIDVNLRETKKNSGDVYVLAMNHVLRAMAAQRLNQTEAARRSLREADEIIQNKLPRLESNDPGERWQAWLMCDLLRREAQAVMENKESE